MPQKSCYGAVQAKTSFSRGGVLKPVRIRIAGYQGEPSVHTRAVRVMMRALETGAGGRVAVEFTPDIAVRGCKVADLLDLVAAGDIDLCYFSSSYLAARAPALGALDIPFQFSERGDVEAQLCGELGAAIKRDIAARTGYVALAFWDNGLRNLSNGRRPVRRPQDCAGLRIRTLPNAAYHATFRALGMEPLTIDVADMVRAIAAGEVDAQENPLTNIQLFGLQRHHRFVTMTGHFRGIALVLCNSAAWAAWPEHVRAALDHALAEATSTQWRMAEQEDRACRSALAEEGVQFVDLDDTARDAFRQAVRDVRDEQMHALPSDVAALLRS
jgi:C4-dicarboxylate-binding protein DctP